MKVQTIQLIILIGILMSCSEPSQNSLKQIEWQIGHEIAEHEELIEVNEIGHLKIDLLRNSLCENSGIQITIQQNNIIIYEKNAELFPFDDIIELEPNSEIKIITRLFDILNNENSCKWLGTANCKIEF